MLDANAKRKAWLTPDEIDPNAGEICRHLYIPNNVHIIAAVSGALHELTLPYNWQQFGTMSPEDTAAIMDEVLWKYFHSTGCGGLAPFWDDAEGDDAEGDEGSPFEWYEDLADWIVTAFLATSFTPEAAIEFVTTARKLRLWFRTRDYGAIVRVLLDGLEIGTIDTYSAEPGLIEFAYDIPEAQGFSAQSEHEHILRLEHSGTANTSATPTANGYAVEIIRKHIEWSVPRGTGRQFRLGLGGRLEYSDDLETWSVADDLPEYPEIPVRPEPTQEEKLCAAARNAAEVLKQTYIAAIEEWHETTDLVSLVVAVSEFFNLTLGIFFAGVWLKLWAFGLVAAGFILAAFNGLLTADWTDEVTDRITCMLLEHATLQPDGRVTFDFPTIRHETSWGIDLRIRIFVQWILDGIGADGLNLAGSTTSVTGYICDGTCYGNWIYDITPERMANILWFTPNTATNCSGNPNGSAPNAYAGTIVEVNGVQKFHGSWAGTTNPPNNLRMAARFYIPPGESTLTGVFVHNIVVEQGSNHDTIGKVMKVNLTCIYQTATFGAQVGLSGTWTGWVDVTINWADFGMHAFRFDAIRLTGTGKNPFI